jgi:hypothetical protein
VLTACYAPTKRGNGRIDAAMCGERDRVRRIEPDVWESHAVAATAGGVL